MDTHDSTTIKLAELLRHPDDLDKLSVLKTDLIRKKAAVDSQLRIGLKEQLEITQSGMSGISEGERTVKEIKEEMMKIDKLCAEAQVMIKDFPQINVVSQTNRNFNAVEGMIRALEGFKEGVGRVMDMLVKDEEDEENMPELLNVHYELTKLRNIRDDAMEQIRRAGDTSFESDLEQLFGDLEDVVAIFDEHIGKIALNLINILMAGNNTLIVRFAVIIEAEEKSDARVLALQEVLKDHADMTARFQGITNGAKEVRGYKEKFLTAIRLHAEGELQEKKQIFLEDSSKIDKSFRWFFNNLNAVKQGMVPLMPKKWKIFQTYAEIYHSVMHDFLISMIDNPDTTSAHMLAILNWPEKYYAKMAKLGFKQDELQPHIIDGREAEMVKEFRSLIIESLDKWISQIQSTEAKDFAERNVEGSNLNNDEFGYFHTRNHVDLWRMLREQTDAAEASGRTDVIEGVIDAMLLRLKQRQQSVKQMIAREAEKYMAPNADMDGFQGLQDWLVAVANDQIAAIEEDDGRVGYLISFRDQYAQLVTPAYLDRTEAQFLDLRDGYVDLGTWCLHTFVSLIIAVDFKSVIPDFFTPKWYPSQSMKQITVTFDEYIGDYKTVLHSSFMEVFIEEMSDALLVAYLKSVRNKGAKIRRVDPFNDKVYSDVALVFEFIFSTQSSQFTKDLLKGKWRATDYFCRLIGCEKSSVGAVYEQFRAEFWDLQLSWVEAVLRTRDDFERSMVNSIKTRAATLEVMGGDETIMSRVK